MRRSDNYRKKCSWHRKSRGPKKPHSAFLFFSSDRSPSLRAEQPSLTALDLSRLLGEEWERLTEEAKKPFIELATKDRNRYEVERQRYY